MLVNITETKELEGMPSVSGIEIFSEKVYLIGDNSQYLYILDLDLNLLDQWQLFVPDILAGEIIPKAYKPDLEALSYVRWKEKDKLMILGSGSKKNRERAFWVDLNESQNRKEYNLKLIYDELREIIELHQDEKVNIEGACSDEKTIYLFQRGNISGKNTMLAYEKNNFIKFLKGKEKKLDSPEIHHYDLPELQEYLAGFSGAGMIPDTPLILFSASIEATGNSIDDGKILGSYLGIIDTKNPDKILDIQLVKDLYQNTFLGKIESVAVKEKTGNHLMVYAVTDNDGPASELLKISVII